MANVPNGVETLPKIFNHLSRVHERYRQTTDSWTGDDIVAKNDSCILGKDSCFSQTS